jgi:hypothetical protein
MPSPWLTHLTAHGFTDQSRLLFHGTGHAVPAFGEAFIGQGADANSALGVHLAEFPEAAAEYATASQTRDAGATGARVLVVALKSQSPDPVHWDFFRFFGEPDDGLPARDHAHFRAERARLRAEGHDVVDYEDGEQVITVALDPADLIVLGELTVEAAEALADPVRALADPFDPRARLTLIAASPGWTPRPVPTPVPRRRPSRRFPG